MTKTVNKAPLSALPEGYDTLTYVTPEIAARFPKERAVAAAGMAPPGVNTLTDVSPAIDSRFPAKNAPAKG